MEHTSDQEQANKWLTAFNATMAQIHLYHLSHSRLAIRLNQSETELLYVFCGTCEDITGPFSWHNPVLQISTVKDPRFINPVYVLTDEKAGFRIVCGDTIQVFIGGPEDFGDSFDNFILAWNKQ